MDSGDDVYCNSLIEKVDTLAKIKNKNKKRTQKYKTKANETSYILATFRWKSNLNAVHSAFEEALVQLPNLDCLTQSPMRILRRCLLKQQTYFQWWSRSQQLCLHGTDNQLLSLEEVLTFPCIPSLYV